jgi:glyoxylase-like metal-dependent hydrolase (beta-lactamase superfamily II)
MKIIDNVYVVPGVTANPYILVDPDGLTVIDAGMKGSEKKILAFVNSLGKSAQDVKRILITHSDLDHVGGLAALKQATGARVYASQVEAEFIARGGSSRQGKASGFSWMRWMVGLMRPFMRNTPCQVDEVLSDGQVLPVLGGLHVVETFGHTPGHLSYFAPAVGVLFCGDSMVTRPNRILGSRPLFTWDDAQAREAERKQAALGARIVCSAHGPAVMDAIGKYPI